MHNTPPSSYPGTVTRSFLWPSPPELSDEAGVMSHSQPLMRPAPTPSPITESEGTNPDLPLDREPLNNDEFAIDPTLLAMDAVNNLPALRPRQSRRTPSPNDHNGSLNAIDERQGVDALDTTGESLTSQENGVADTVTIGGQKVRLSSINDIRMYSQPGENLDWTRVTNRAERKRMQNVIRTRKDKTRRDNRKRQATNHVQNITQPIVLTPPIERPQAVVNDNDHSLLEVGIPSNSTADTSSGTTRPPQPPLPAQTPVGRLPSQHPSQQPLQHRRPAATAIWQEHFNRVAHMTGLQIELARNKIELTEHVMQLESVRDLATRHGYSVLPLTAFQGSRDAENFFGQGHRRTAHSGTFYNGMQLPYNAANIQSNTSAMRQPDPVSEIHYPPLATDAQHDKDRPLPETDGDMAYVEAVKASMTALIQRRGRRSLDFASSTAGRIKQLLDVAKPPDCTEALYLTGSEASQHLAPNHYFTGIIITQNQQALPLQTPEQFLNEYYDDTAEVNIQDPGINTHPDRPHVRVVTIGAVRERFQELPGGQEHPWNCLELACHYDDGIRPRFLSGEECRLLTKLKGVERNSVGRPRYDSGWKEVEKWALLAQGGALTPPHQDSHGYNTFITINQGPIGFGWLANPTAMERASWQSDPDNFTGGRWRWVVLRNGQTVYFPSGTVHFVFRYPAAGNTLAFGGHILRCSQIVQWAQTMLEEKANPAITNEDLTAAATRYLNQVERFVKQARRDGSMDRWGGVKAIDAFLRIKADFERHQD